MYYVYCHNRGKVRTINRFKPVKLLGFKQFDTRSEALMYEKDLKTKASCRKKFIKNCKSAHLPA